MNDRTRKQLPGVVTLVLVTTLSLASMARADVTAAQLSKDPTALEALAAHHAEMAADYRARASVQGSKQSITFATLANHCERLAEQYRRAALEKRRS